ncbi:proton-conducting transporter membrane subunit [Verrucomicrobium spinosum]|uniref:proton-conducting transporter transmembrane domain-containing protein n=2 Tax=Verrucomicrobium spinosum TaxID=2736 RepID=UPI00017465A4|nr:proton-conducting transporter membrane subunit [Verrucomicrobium spinosum]
MNLPSTDPTHPIFFVSAVAAGPLVMLAAALVPSRLANRHGRRFAALASWLSLGVFVVALSAGIGFLFAGPLVAGGLGVGSVRIGVYFDMLSAVMLLLVSFLGAVVVRFAGNYLAGDPQQGKFTKWLCVTIGSVLVLCISGDLLMFTLSWTATSLSLHKLLTFHPDRPAAMLAARKKFLISRLGDACLVGALVMTWQCFGTWNFTEMFAAAAVLREQGGAYPSCLGWTSVLLVAGALLKSAQFPFHSWLPDTMETPTPVSALMHAGIINAGGFLVVRLSPIIAGAPAALNALAVVGAFTALFASLVMLTQTSVKRSLAYSTIAQMGFMMLQCGLGAFALAVLHIVAHSLYKAHAFLSSGSIVSMTRSAWVPSERPGAHPLILVITLSSAIALTWGVGAIFKLSPASDAGVMLLGAVFMMGLAHLLWNLWASSHRSSLVDWGLLVGGGVAIAYFALHAAFEKLLASSVASYTPLRSPLEFGVMAMVVLLFMAVLVLQSQLPCWSATRLGRVFYVHASQAFYLGQFANRLTLAIYGKKAV